MAFTGFSSDEEGSIVFDGEQFIINNPDNVPPDFDPGDRPVIYTRPPVATRPQPTSVPDDILDYEREQEKRLAISPASQNDERSSSGSSQTKIPADTNQANDESRVQAVLPDIEEAQDDFGTGGLVDGISPDRLHAFSNLEFLRVKQDIEARPLTFKRCFEQSQSPRSALEFIYAVPPDLDDNAMIHLQDYLSQAPDTMSGGWGITGGREDSSTPDIDPGLLSTVYKVEEHLETKYGYEIAWGEGFYNAERLEHLHELAQASEHIVDYLAQEVYGDEHAALEAFKTHFGQSKFGQLENYLGADAYIAETLPATLEEDAGSYASVPLPVYDKEGKLISTDVEELKKMYLGSAVDIPTIVHEFGHVIDRSLRIEDEYTDTWGTVFPWPDWIRNVGLPLNHDILKHAIGGYAGKQFLSEEIWADLFMTAVLDPSNPYIDEPYTVYSTTFPAHNEIVNERAKVLSKPYMKDYGEEVALQIGRDLAIAEFYDCAVHDDCKKLEVKWAEKSPDAWKDFGALAREHFPTLLRHLLSG